MASRIAKGFSLCTAIIGFLCLIAGIGIAVCAWVLNGQLPTGFRYQDSEGRYGTVSIGNYWWGGMIYLLPGIIGIIAGCTRNVTAMVVYLIFNLLCCICSLVVVVMCGLVLLIWVVVDSMLQSGQCHNAMIEKACICKDYQRGSDFKLYGGSCEVFMNIQVIVGAMVSMAAISSILSFIASYISCCALCNKESNHGGVIISGGAGVYQPPPVVVGNTTGYPPHYDAQSHPPPPYAQQQPTPYNPNYPQQAVPYNAYPMPYATSDSKANLVNNEYR